MLHLHDQIQEAVSFIRQKWQGQPHAGIILGTGLGSLVEEIEVEASIDYGEIPHFPQSTAVSHAGRLICGKLGGLPVMAMEGRFHMYEGYELSQITLPVRVFKAMGVELLVVSNACGGMNPYYQCGDIMVIEDHINLLGDNPLIGINDDRLGPRFPDMCEPYDQRLVDRAARNRPPGRHHRPQRSLRGGRRAEPRNPRRIPHAPHPRRRRRRHEHGAGSDRRGALRPANRRLLHHHRHVPARRPEAGGGRKKSFAIANEAAPKLKTLVTGVLAGEK